MLTDDDVKWSGELPIVLVSPETGDGYLTVEQGPGAEARAAEWVGARPEIQPVIFDIHDERCPHCNRTYWHEAASGSETDGWHCPHCGKLLAPVKERKTVGEILKAESDALSSAMMGLANSDTYFENDEERFESAEDYFLAVCHVREAVEKLEEAARKFLRDAEEGLPE